MPFAYILYSVRLDKYYIGSCTNLERRLYEHNSGHSKFTSLGVPWQVVYLEEFEVLLDARRREMQIKRMKSRRYIEDLIAKGRASRL
ncbi:MAG: GIY-YIG nuclease family protein [Chitinophagaceae bacterium]|nr:GIY-YIG nuclease family protein [Chitinophagaceae bacterium]